MRTLLLSVLGSAVACGPTPPERPPISEIAVAAEPEAPLDAVPAVVRFRITGLAVPAAGVVLLEDALGSYHEGRIRDADVPSTLIERLVPVTAFDAEAGTAVVVPARRLRAGGTYTLAALGRGALATFVVEERESAPFAGRLFPRAAEPGGTRWVFCGASLDGPREVFLEPDGVRAVARPGAAGGPAPESACFHLNLSGARAEGVLVPPPRIGPVALDPAPVTMAARSAATEISPAICKPGEAPLEPGCVAIQDDRVVVRSAEVPLVWALAVGETSTVVATDAGGRFVVGGLEPGASVRVLGVAADASGRELRVERELTTAPLASHVVVNEVLANPNGPEPAQEWVELFNDGRRAEAIGGCTLGDDDGESVLPPFVLEPGAFALVVQEGFDVGGHRDVPVREGTIVVRVPRLGQSGLSNSGERVTLRAPDGRVVSSFPPVAPPGSGVSVARRSPSALDDDVGGFAASAGPGASPGAPNEAR